MAEDRNPNLKNKAVFTDRDLTMGIPTRVFIATLFLALFSAFVFCKYMGAAIGLPLSILLALLILIPVYLVHKEDQEAYIVWLRSLFAPHRLSAGRSVRRRVLILVPAPGGALKPQPMTERK